MTEQMNSEKTPGKVYVASMIMRGKRAELPKELDNAVKVNVTSAQRTNNPYRVDFSPMTAIPGKYKGYHCFENYWQSGKIFQDGDREKQLQWWKKQEKGKRRYPGSKGNRVLHAVFNGEEYDYVNSRKYVYVPEYYEVIKNTNSLKELIEMRNNGKNIVIFDFDGPRKENGDNTYKEVTMEMLVEEIHNIGVPFGHGYIIAAAINGNNLAF
jgi:hypothetical protein